MIGVVFDGGGVKGSYQVGAYLALQKCGIKPNIIAGTSIGAFNGAMCAAHQEKELKKLWQSINFAKTFGINEKDYYATLRQNLSGQIDSIYKILLSTIKSKGIDTLGLRKILDEYIDEDRVRKSNIDFGMATFNLTEKKPLDTYISNIPKGKLKEYILASAYLPIFKSEKIINDNLYLDGGFYNTCPVNLCIDAGCDLIYVIRVKGIGYSQRIKKHKSKIIYISSNENLGSIIFTNHERCQYNMDLGYYDTLRAIRKLDGEKYYFRYRYESTYSYLIKNVDKEIIKNIQRIFKTLNTKKLVIKSLEYIMNKEGYDRFKIYSQIAVIMQIKKIGGLTDIVYDFVSNLNIL